MLPCSGDAKHYDPRTGLYETFEERVDRMEQELIESQARARAQPAPLYPAPNFPVPEVYSDDEDITEFYGEYMRAESDSDIRSNTVIIEQYSDVSDVDELQLSNYHVPPPRPTDLRTFLPISNGTNVGLSEGRATEYGRSRSIPWLYRTPRERASTQRSSTAIINDPTTEFITQSFDELLRNQAEYHEIRMGLVHQLRRFGELLDSMVDWCPDDNRGYWIDMQTRIAELERDFIDSVEGDTELEGILADFMSLEEFE